MDCSTLRYSRHAFERMFQRGIPPDAVTQIIAEGEVIADYLEDQPYPSVLLLGTLPVNPCMQWLLKSPARGTAIW